MALNNFSIVVVLALLAVTCTSTKVNHDCGSACSIQRPTGMITQISGGISPASLNTPQFRRVDAFIRKTRHELRRATAISARSQVVGGTRWYIIYSIGRRRVEVDAVDQPWRNNIRIESVRPLRGGF